MALKWKNGFIHWEGEGKQGQEEAAFAAGAGQQTEGRVDRSLSRKGSRARARSDPRSESGSAASAEWFDREREYVESLNVSVENFRTSVSSWSEIQSRISESGKVSTTSDDKARDSGDLDESIEKARTQMSLKLRSQAAMKPGRELRSDAVKQRIQQNLFTAKHQKTKHLTTALAAIEEITAQVSDVLESSGTMFAKDVEDTIGELRTKMRIELVQEDEPVEGAADVAIESLDVIPEMIVQTFEASANVAKRTLQNKVDNMLQGIANMELSNEEEVVSKMRSIPAEVEDITQKAVTQAVSASQNMAQVQVNLAMVKLPGWQNSLTDTARKINAGVPGMGTLTVQVATEAAVETMENAVAAVKENEKSSTVTNQVVADTLLRAKADVPEPEEESPRALIAEAINPGSIGHPELCTRPCLYFATGSCMNGADCEFCHLPHPKRPAHLDKRNREMLKSMPLAECVSLVLPVLEGKVEELGLGSELMRLVQKVADAATERPDSPSAGSTPSRKMAIGAKERQSLLTALRAMSLRSLLMMLNRNSLQPPTHPQNQAIDAVWQHVRCRSHFIANAEGSVDSSAHSRGPQDVPELQGAVRESLQKADPQSPTRQRFDSSQLRPKGKKSKKPSNR